MIIILLSYLTIGVYLIYFFAGKATLNPKNLNYSKLFNKKYFINQLLISILIALPAIIKTLISSSNYYYGFFSYLFFLIAFHLLNKISWWLHNRNFIVILKHDLPPPEHRISDTIIGALLFLVAICSPMIYFIW
jgi:hypothetical protein